MMSKIKSKKIANVKVLIGMVLAASLIAVFACEQKQTIKTDTTTEDKNVTVTFQGKELQVSGDSATIESLKMLINTKVEMGVAELPTAPPPPPPIGKPITVDGRDDVYVVVDEMPEYPGGVQALRNFLAQAVKYPAEAASKGIQGKVYVTFIVDKDGSTKNAKIARGVDPSLDAEALRVVSSLPKWIPGKQKGQAVAVQYTVPINFKLE